MFVDKNRQIKQRSKNEMQVEFGQDFEMAKKQTVDGGSLSAREAGTKTKKLVALGEEMLMNNSKTK